MTVADLLATISSMWLPLTVLTIAGTATLILAWWLSVKAEGKDEWLWSETPELHGLKPGEKRTVEIDGFAGPGVYEIELFTFDRKGTTP